MPTFSKELVVQLSRMHAFMADSCRSGAGELCNVVSLRNAIAMEITERRIRVLMSTAQVVGIEVDLIISASLGQTLSTTKPSQMWPYTEQYVRMFEGVLLDTMSIRIDCA